jgi:hypothetical protein
MNQTYVQSTLRLILSLSLLLAHTHALAQQRGTVKLTDTQDDLIKTAKKKATAKNPDYRSIAGLYSIALKEGPADVLFASLGTILAKQGLCIEARQNFLKALTAPIALNSNPNETRDYVEEKLQNLEETCPGSILPECAHDGVALRALAPSRPAWTPVDLSCDVASSMPPGQYTLIWTDGDRTGQLPFEVQAMKQTSLTVQTAPSPGSLTVSCKDPATRLSVNQQDLSCGESITLPPGEYTLLASLGAETRQEQLQIQEAQSHTVNIALQRTPDDDGPSSQTPTPIVNDDTSAQRPRPTPSPRVTQKDTAQGGGVAAPVFFTLGGLFLAGAGLAALQVNALDEDAQKLADQNSIDNQDVQTIRDGAAVYEPLQWVSLGLGVTGIILGFAYLNSDSDDNERSDLQFDAWADPRGEAGVLMRGAW